MPLFLSRRRLSGLLNDTGALSRILELRARTGAPWFSILTYHRFFAAPGNEPFDEGVVDTSAEEFERHVTTVKKHFNVVGVEELCAFVAGGSLPSNAVAITFDDGYLDNCLQALPILLKHDCKAIFFVATSFINERRLYWWDRVAYLIKQSKREHVSINYPRHFTITLADRAVAVFELLRFIKSCSLIDLEYFLGELSVATGVSWSPEVERSFSEQLLMTWDHVRALKQAGMDVQSHTRSHRILQTLSPSELEGELEGSRRDLQQQLGEAPVALAYPVGKPLAKESPIRGALKRAGYQIGLSNGTGATPTWGRRDPFDIRRQTVARDLATPFLLSILAVPPLAPKYPWHRVRML